MPYHSFLRGNALSTGFVNRPIYNWEKILEVIQKYAKKARKKNQAEALNNKCL
jgi:hypothetical protein